MSSVSRQTILSTSALLVVLLTCLLIGKFITTIPLVPLLIVVSIFLFLFGIMFTEQAMVLLIIAMLLSPEITLGAVSKRQDVMVRIDDLLIVVFMLAWLARSAVTKSNRFISHLPVNRFVLFYCLAFSLSTLKGMLSGTVVPLKGFFYIFKYIEYFMVFYLAAGVIKDRQQVLYYVKIFAFVLLAVNIYACTQIGHERVSAPFEGKPGEPNTLGGYQVLLLAIILGILTHCRSFHWKWPFFLLSIFTLIPFSFTESRASYAAMIPMYLTLIFFAKGRMRNSLLLALAVIIIAGIFFMPPVIKQRIMYTFSPDIDESIAPVTVAGVTLDPSASARINDWTRLIDIWKKEPFLGQGVTGVGFVDSQYISVLVESGLIGLVAFILLLWSILRRTLAIYKSTKDDLYEGLSIGFLAGSIGMLVHAITANTFIIIRIMEPYWFFAAMVMMIPKLEARVKDSQNNERKQEQQRNLLNTSFLLRYRS